LAGELVCVSHQQREQFSQPTWLGLPVAARIALAELEIGIGQNSPQGPQARQAPAREGQAVAEALMDAVGGFKVQRAGVDQPAKHGELAGHDDTSDALSRRPGSHTAPVRWRPRARPARP
jgi:hypothetical protein